MAQRSIEAILGDIGSALRQIRINAGHSQQELADLANVSRSTIHHLENGTGSNLESFVRVLRVLDRVDVLDQLDEGTKEFDPFTVLEAANTKPRQRVGKR